MQSFLAKKKILKAGRPSKGGPFIVLILFSSVLTNYFQLEQILNKLTNRDHRQIRKSLEGVAETNVSEFHKFLEIFLRNLFDGAVLSWTCTSLGTFMHSHRQVLDFVMLKQLIASTFKFFASEIV